MPACLPPGPRRALIGTLLMPGRDPLALFANLARTYGDVVHFKMGGERVFFINHPQYIRDVLMTAKMWPLRSPQKPSWNVFELGSALSVVCVPVTGSNEIRIPLSFIIYSTPL